MTNTTMLSDAALVYSIPLPQLHDPPQVVSLIAWILTGVILLLAAYSDHKYGLVSKQIWIPALFLIGITLWEHPPDLPTGIVIIILTCLTLAIRLYNRCGGADFWALATSSIIITAIFGWMVAIIYLGIGTLLLPTAVQTLDAAINTAHDKTHTFYEHFQNAIRSKYRLIPVFAAAYWLSTSIWYILTYKL